MHHRYTSHKKKKRHANNKDVTVNFTGRSTDVAPPLHQYPTQSILIEAANNIATVTPYGIEHPRKLQMNAVIHPETRFAQ